MSIEKTILKNLIRNDVYTRKVLPFLKEEYFRQEEYRILFKEVRDFITKYNTLPTYDALDIEINSLLNIKDDHLKSILSTIEDIKKDKDDTQLDWLSDTTEKFCQEQAIYNAITKSIDIMDNKDKTLGKGSIPQLLSDALAVTFDPNVGHDFFSEYDERYEYYHRVEDRIPFDLEFFNKITKNGIPKKTLNVILGGVHCVSPETKVKIRFRKRISN